MLNSLHSVGFLKIRMQKIRWNDVRHSRKKLKVFCIMLIIFFLFTTIHVFAGETRATVFRYVVGDYSDTTAEGAIRSWNAKSQFDYQQCKNSGPNANCSISVLKQNGIGSSSLVNGVYTLYGLDITTTYESSSGQTTVQQYPNSTTIFEGQTCGNNSGFGGGNLVQLGNTADGYPIYNYQCIRPDQLPQLQCPAKGAPPRFGNPISLYDGTKTENFIDYQTPDGLLEIKRNFLGQNRGWVLPENSRLLDLYSNTSVYANASTLEYYSRFNPSTGQAEDGYESVPSRLLRSSPNGEVDFVSDIGVLNISLASSLSNPLFSHDVNGVRILRLATPTAEGAIWARMVENDTEEYGADGRIRKLKKRGGRSVTYQYLNDQLVKVIDNFGRKLNYHYGFNGLVDQIQLPDGLFIRYGYLDKALASVTYQDGSVFQFLYNEPNNISSVNATFLLTGKIDENGKRTGSYFYDSAARAISTELAGGVGKYSFTFGYSYSQFVDPLGSTYTYYFSNSGEYAGISRANYPAGSGCGSAFGYYNYDDFGNVSSSIDFNGTTTTYLYDLTRKLETSRTEGSGTAQARTISTQWHPSYRLPTQVAEPLRRTIYTYDAQGNRLTRTEQATSDATGTQVFSAPLIGTARSWTWTYTNLGQVLTADGPRTDTGIVDKTTYTYDAVGNVATITDATGKLTRMTSYDLNGRLLAMTDPNGAVTTMTYSPRGWLTSRNVTSGSITEATSYTYDAAGQLTKVTLPGATTVNYIYDDAHRLTNVADNLGNTIAYTLDPMGNRINEQIKDPSGALVRQTSRVYDARNRLQQVTGAVQ